MVGRAEVLHETAWFHLQNAAMLASIGNAELLTTGMKIQNIVSKAVIC